MATALTDQLALSAKQTLQSGDHVLALLINPLMDFYCSQVMNHPMSEMQKKKKIGGSLTSFQRYLCVWKNTRVCNIIPCNNKWLLEITLLVISHLIGSVE